MPNQRRFDELRQRWEERACTYQSAPVGVLYRGLSPALNDYVHRFHLRCLSELLGQMPKAAKLLDVGCGYGRIGMAVRDERPDIEIVGCDVTLAYCRLHQSKLGADTICGDLEALPFRPGSFDAVVAVTALMYLQPGRRADVVSAVLGLLRPGGVALFVEPSQEMLTLMTWMRPGSARETTGGSGYRQSELAGIAQAAGCVKLSAGGMPVFTITLPVLLLLGRWPDLQSAILGKLVRLDSWLAGFTWFSLQRWLLLRCPGGART